MSTMLLERNHFDEDTRIRDESLFHCASGKIGVRGCFEEGAPEGVVSIRGTYLNGFAETEVISYNEKLYGFTDSKETIVNLPDAQGVEFRVDGNKLCCWSENAGEYRYALDMSAGTVVRHFTYSTNNGRVELNFERFASVERPGLFTIGCRVKSIDFCGELEVKSFLNGDVRNFTTASDPRTASGDGRMLKVNSAYIKEYNNGPVKFMEVEAETINSHRKVSTTVLTDISFSGEGKCTKVPCEYVSDGKLITARCSVAMTAGDELLLHKYCYYQELPGENDAYRELYKAWSLGFDGLKEEQKSCINRFWDVSRVMIDSSEVKQEYIDFCLYALYCSAGRDGKTSISAKGLTGEGYEGHYFWDSEIYIFPFFLLTNPEIAKSLILYRYSKLESAKKHARIMGHESGALYPWRTITGSECSSHYPTGSAQYHINGDIALAFAQYWNVTEDMTVLPEICEVLLETARLWMDVGHYKDGTFRIEAVTGPDEYTCMVNNNYYTNAGAAANLKNAVRLITILKISGGYEKLKDKTGLTEEELLAFSEASEKMYLPYDEKLGIIMQDDSFLDKKILDIASIPKENFPLLLHYHPLFLTRHQVCKQADAVLADFLFSNLKPITSKRTFDYYEAITTHDSSLSKCIFGIMAGKLGDSRKAKEYFLETLSTDMDDMHKNTRDGLHTANMGGSYLMVVRGFADITVDENGIKMFPMLPEGFRAYSFPLTYKGRCILVSVDADGVKLKLKSGDPVEIEVYGRKITVEYKETCVKRKCRAVIFDLDGVITDTAGFHYKAWKKIADELGIPFDEEKNEAFKGVSRKTCLELLLKWGNKELSSEEFENTLVRKNDYYKEMLNDLTPDDILPGIKECIKDLKNKGIKTALFSVSKNTDAILNRLSLSDEFDAKVTGYDIEFSKPHFEGYLKAAERLNVDPRLCIMVEDSVAGIEGAKKLLLKTFAIMKENAADADICVPSTVYLNKINQLL